MWRSRPRISRLLIVWPLLVAAAFASEHRGEVMFGALPVPGATVTATRGNQKLATVTDERGQYSFPALEDVAWTIEVQMQCFATVKRDVTVAPDAPAAEWQLALLPAGEIKTVEAARIAAPLPVSAQAASPGETNAAQAPAETRPAEEQNAAD